jgi:hypothetical protein
MSLDSPGWPSIETSCSGRTGFWRERTPTVFGYRRGVGPLIVALDTAILISLRDELEAVEEGAGLVCGPLWSDLGSPTDALRDLIQLWWWRDVRFWVCDLHLADARKPLSPERRLARAAAVRELEQDFFERGGFETILRDDTGVIDRPCPAHAVPRRLRSDKATTSADKRLPRGLRDRQLVCAAHDAGCHAFVTTDKGILRCSETLAALGLAILSPTQLLSAFDESGELDDSPNPMTAPAPDLAAISRLYAGFAPA